MIHNLFPLYSILLIFKFLIYYPLLLLILVYCRRTERTILTVQGGQSQNDRGTSMCTSIDKERNVEYVLSKEKLEYSKSIIDDFYRESSIQRKDLLSNQVRNSHYVRVNSLLRPPSPYFFPSRFSSSLIHCSSSFSSDSFSYSSYSYSSYSYSSSYHSSYSTPTPTPTPPPSTASPSTPSPNPPPPPTPPTSLTPTPPSLSGI